MTPTDRELLARASASADREAFGELVRRHQSAVRRFLRHLTRGDHARADDLAQDTFLLAWRRIDRFRGDSNLATWLFGIAYNHFRNARRRDPPTPLAPSSKSSPEIAPSHVPASDLRHDLASALRQLDLDEQTALHLCYQQGLSHSEIATITGWHLGTVKTHLARGKEKLRPLLAPWNPNH